MPVLPELRKKAIEAIGDAMTEEQIARYLKDQGPKKSH